MVLLKHLYNECAQNTVSKVFPAQIACRLLGSSAKPCCLKPICSLSKQRGLWVFYTLLTAGAAGAFVLIYWLLALTRLNKILNPIAKILIKPFGWLAGCFAAAVRFYKGLPF